MSSPWPTWLSKTSQRLIYVLWVLVVIAGIVILILRDTW